MTKKKTCKGTTKGGQPCKRKAGPSGYCHLHAPPDDGLTDRRRRFVDEYLVDLNGTQAAIRAGYAPKGAHSEAYRLLRNVKVRAAIDERLEAAGLTALEVLAGLSDIARGSLAPFINIDGDKPVLDLTSQAAQAALGTLKEVTFGEDGSIKLKLHDKLAALVHLGKAHGVFVDRQELSGPDGKPIEHEVKARIVAYLPSNDRERDPGE
jgi:phage terminase small subunit